MSMSYVVPPLNLLLNSISNDLSRRNLQSLIDICERYIPESKREEIKNGFDVFRILKQQNVIGDDHQKVCNLEEIVKAMRPRRRDIVKRVRNFIRENYDPCHDFESSGESCVYREPAAVLVPNHHQPPPVERYNSSSLETLSGQRDPSVEVTSSTENHCSMDCCCWGCNCYARRIPPCVLLILTGIMAILTFLSVLLRFGHIPKNLYEKLGSDGQKAGGYVVGCFGVITIAFLCWWIYRKFRGNRHVGQVPYQHFTDDASSPVAVDNQMDACSTLVHKGSTIPPTSVKLPIRKKQKRRPHGTMTADSSLDTAASASVLEREQQQRHYPAKRVPRTHKKSTTDDGGLQTDGACGSAETDEFQSKESLFLDYSSDYSIDESTVPPMTAE